MDYLDDLEEQARQMRVMDAVVRRYLNKGMTMALNQWTHVWREMQRIKTLVRRMGKDGGVGKAWRQWKGVAEQNAWLKGVAGRFKGGTSKAFNRWLEMLEERYAMRRFAKCVLASHHSRAPPPQRFALAI